MTHFTAWSDLTLIWKHKYSLPAGDNLVVVCNLSYGIGSVAFDAVRWVCVTVAWTLQFGFHGVTNDWMSSLFEMLFLFWLVVMCLLSSIDKIDGSVELIPDDVWEGENDKTGFLSVGVDSFNQLFLYKQPNSLPMMQNINKNRKYDKWG